MNDMRINHEQNIFLVNIEINVVDEEQHRKQLRHAYQNMPSANLLWPLTRKRPDGRRTGPSPGARSEQNR